MAVLNESNILNASIDDFHDRTFKNRYYAGWLLEKKRKNGRLVPLQAFDTRQVT